MRERHSKNETSETTSGVSMNRFVKSYPNFYKFLEERTQDERSAKRVCKIFGEVLDADGKEKSIRLSQKRVDRHLRAARKALEALGDDLDVTIPLG